MAHAREWRKHAQGARAFWCPEAYCPFLCGKYGRVSEGKKGCAKARPVVNIGRIGSKSAVFRLPLANWRCPLV